MRNGLFLAPLALAAACLGQEPAMREERVYGRQAWVLDNGVLRVALLRGGGHIAEVRFTDGSGKPALSPMRVPHYATIEPYDYDDQRHNTLYGNTPHRRLHSGYMGHLLCFPFYGPPSEAEAQAGLGNHGEAPVVEWRLGNVERRSDSIRVSYGASLPKTQYRVERAVTLRKGARQVLVEEWVENLTDQDRPINWMQHATFGPPFIEPGRTMLDVSATRGQVSGGRPENRSVAPGMEVKWPEGRSPDGRPVSLRPMQPAEATGTYVALLLDPSRRQQYFTLYHPGRRLLIGYVFPSEGSPWIADWQENRSNPTPPWNSRTVARGIEWGTTPFAEGLRRSVERGSLLGAPAYRWIGARERLKTEYTIFLEEIPEDYRGVADVRLDGGRVEITPK